MKQRGRYDFIIAMAAALIILVLLFWIFVTWFANGLRKIS